MQQGNTNFQFKPLLQIPDCVEPIETVIETKLLGYWLTTDMKPQKHVDHMLGICYKRLWAIPKLKRAGVSNNDILHFYCIKIRSVLESNCAVYHSMLTEENKDDLERIQKIVLKVILDHDYQDYTAACQTLKIQTLDHRRTNICLKFALKCLASEKFKHMFKPNRLAFNLRDPDKFDVPFAITTRYKDSPKVFLTRLLNDYFKNKNSWEARLLGLS